MSDRDWLLNQKRIHWDMAISPADQDEKTDAAWLQFHAEAMTYPEELTPEQAGELGQLHSRLLQNAVVPLTDDEIDIRLKLSFWMQKNCRPKSVNRDEIEATALVREIFQKFGVRALISEESFKDCQEWFGDEPIEKRIWPDLWEELNG